MIKICQECIFELWENRILRMNGEILKLWILPEMHLSWCWSANAMGAFQHISILRTYFCNLTFSLTLLCFHLRTSQSMLGKEFRSSKRTVQLYLTHRFNTTIINPISHPHSTLTISIAPHKCHISGAAANSWIVERERPLTPVWPL